MTRAPRLYFSFRSPFSWLMVERLRRIAPATLKTLELMPYWEPDAQTAEALARRGAAIHYAPMSKAKHLYILQDVRRLASALRLEICWPVDTDPWWEPAHLGWLAARRQGRAWELYDALVDARWGRGEDISRRETVAAAARTAGLDPETVAGAIEDPETRVEGEECLYRAYQDDVFGVPYLIAGWQRFWGYDRLEAFLEFARHVGAPEPIVRGATIQRTRAPEPVAALRTPRMYDNDTAGGCG